MSKIKNSMKGKWGTVGAPPRPVEFPSGPFVLSDVFDAMGSDRKRNKTACRLTIRTDKDRYIAAGYMKQLANRPQPNGGVGRPAEVFELTKRGAKHQTKLLAKLAGTAVSHNKSATRRTRKATTAASTAELAPATPPVEVASVAAPAPEPVQTETAHVETVESTSAPAPAPEAAPVAAETVTA
jgi:hypothetical protein